MLRHLFRRLVPMHLVVCVFFTQGCTSAGGPPILLSGGAGSLIVAARSAPADAETHYQAALAQWKRRNWPAVAELLDQALLIDQHHAEAYLVRSFLPYFRLSDRELERKLQDPAFERTRLRAAEDYRTAFLMDPLVDQQVPGALFGIGRPLFWGISLVQVYDFFARRDYQGALDFLNQNRGATNPETRSAYHWFRGLAAIHVGEFDAASFSWDFLLREAFENSLSDSLVVFTQETNMVRYLLAWVHQQKGDHNQATFLYREALGNDLGLYMAHSRLAQLYEERERFDEALQERRAAMFLNSEDSQLRVDLALTMAAAGQVDAAVAELLEAMEVNERHVMIWYHLGDVYEASGNRQLSSDAYRQFLDISPENMTEFRMRATEILRARAGAGPQ